MLEIIGRVRKAALSFVTVLILGESGTGKELAARSIHSLSARSSNPFIAVNPAALSESVLESELFGHEKGAFTGAASLRIGLIESANGGTLFLDEVGDMPLHVQVKLLRVIENREILRVGSSSPVRVDVRIVAATHKDLAELVKRGAFRQDLYFRLNGILIELPPLRERVQDLPLLLGEILADSPEAQKKEIRTVSEALQRKFVHYPWPGNLRELRQFVDAMVVEDEDGLLDLDDLPPHIARVLEGSLPQPSEAPTLDDVKKQRVLELLRKNHRNVSRTARELGVDRGTIYKWLRKWGMSPRVFDMAT